jgi:manganese transport system permease protein
MTDLIDLLLDPWRSGIDRRAILEVVLLGLPCGALSVWVSSYRLSYTAESLSHGLLPGLVLASLAGAPLLLGAGGGVAVAGLLVALAGRDERVGEDTATAVVVTGAFGLGALLALSPDAPARLEELLFGDPLGVSDSDLFAAGVLAVAGGAALAALHRPLTAIAVDPVAARSQGVPVLGVRIALIGLMAAAVAVAVQGLGSLLVLAVLVAPAVTVRRHASSPGRAVLAASLVSALAGIAGIYASRSLGVAAGAAVALSLCAAAALGSALAPGALRRAGPAAR